MTHENFTNLLHCASNHANICCEEVNRICHPLFKNSPINYFDYNRFYDSGEAIVMSSVPDFTKKGFARTLFPSLEEYQLMHAAGLKTAFLSQSMPLPFPSGVNDYIINKYSEIIATASDLKIFHRMYFIERRSDYFQVSGFGTTCGNISIINYFINSLNSLRNFVQHFENSASDLIESFTQSNRIIIPSYLEHKLEIEGIILPPNPPLPITCKTSVNDTPATIITKRENECLAFIAQGYTMKRIAQLLTISPRTVENHLRNIKDKFGINTKNQLVEIWNEHRKK